VEPPTQNKKDIADGPISVTFNIRAQTQYGEELFVVGSLPQLGSWNPFNAIKLQTNKESYPNWSVTTTLLSRVVEYKVQCIMGTKTHSL
jgi:alpha-amylase